MEKRGLGKGLDALIPKRVETIVEDKEFTYLPLTKIEPGKYQPRQELDQTELAELTRSIKEKGVIQPIIVRKRQDNNYEIVAGHRRFFAAKALGLNEIPTVIKQLEDKDAFIFAIVENLQRQDLNPIEEAQAFSRLMQEFEYTLDQLANFLGKDKTTISNALRLLKLPPQIREALRKGLINRGQARTILAVNNQAQQLDLFQEILSSGMSVREIEQQVKKISPFRKKAQDPFVLEVEVKLQQLLGTKVKISHKRDNKGKIVIEYFSLNDLERIMARLK